MVKKGELNISIGTIIMLVITFILSLFGVEESTQSTENNKLEKLAEINIMQEKIDKNLELYFCPQDNCSQVFYNTINKATQSINCALHEFDDLNTSKLLVKKSKQGVQVNIIIEDKYSDEHGLEPINNNLGENLKLKTDGTNSKLMHHKFCVIDNEITLTGSTNPTPNGLYKNNNNMLVIYSKQIAKNYNLEFNENLNKNIFQKKKSDFNYPILELETPKQNYTFDIEMCPSDECRTKTLNILQTAEKEILFANFVLTQNDIEILLVEKANNNVTVKGVIENRLKNSKGAMIKELNESFPISIDKNKNTMHHKFFIVDELYVITGSMNPSASGTYGNDENLIIIKNKKMALEFKEEFNLLISD
jgi:phosphatidylserine/phosphatidylglycerophosphate/cardiolipin synthase-like enzyme